MKKIIAGAFALALVGGLAAPAVAADGLQAAYDKCVAAKVPAHKAAYDSKSSLSDADYAAAQGLCTPEREALVAAQAELKVAKTAVADAEKELAKANADFEVASVARKHKTFEAEDAKIAETKKALDEANKGDDLDAKAAADNDYQAALAAKEAAVKNADKVVADAQKAVEDAAKKVAESKAEVAKVEAKIGAGAPAVKKEEKKPAAKEAAKPAAKPAAKGAMGLPKSGK